MNKQEIENSIEAIKLLYDYNVYGIKEHHVRTALECMTQQLNNRWIPVSERLPSDENPVDVTARRKEGARGYFVYKAHYIAPHTKTTEDYGWDSDYTDWEYDEENDCYWIPECWYEDNAIADNCNYILDDEFDILAWKPLSEPYKEAL
jgi:hypothetical protein